MKKRLLSVIMAFLICALCLPPIPASAATTNDAVTWMNEHEGWYIDFDNAYGGQCVDVPMRYCHDLFGWNPGGNACDYRSNYLPEGWQRFQYSAGVVPQPGDIIVYQPNWGDPIWTGEFGHVGLVYSANASGMVTMEQNTGEGDALSGGTRMRRLNRSYGGVWGFIRPPFSNNGNVPAPADNITLDFPWIGFTEDTNAQIGSFIRNGGATVGCPSFGLQIWEKSTGKRIVNHSEDISSSVQQMTEIKIWNNLTTELGVTLKPGTEYEFQFSAVKNGKTYYSEKNTFKTTGKAPETIVKVTGVTVSKSALTLKEGETASLTAAVSPADAKDKSVVWSSNNASVASVDASGKVTAKAAGAAEITVKTNDGGFTAVCRVIVKGKDKPAPVKVHFPQVDYYVQGQFVDVPAKQWYTDGVKQSYEMGLMKGKSFGRFDPKGYVTVAEAITMAARLHSIYSTGEDNFTQSSPWYQVYLDYAFQNGIIGYNYYTSNVSKRVATRAQFAEIFAKAFPDEALSPISTVADGAIPDVPMSASYASHVYKLYRAGVLTGNDVLGTFSPDSYITRQEAATLVSRMAESNNRKSFTLG